MMYGMQGDMLMGNGKTSNAEQPMAKTHCPAELDVTPMLLLLIVAELVSNQISTK
jgi:hypothetical protein